MHASTRPLQLCLTVCDPVDCSPSGSSVHGILQARILEWVAMSSSRGPSWPRNRIHISYVSCINSQVLLMCVLVSKWGIQDSNFRSMSLTHCTLLGGIVFENEVYFIIPRKKRCWDYWYPSRLSHKNRFWLDYRYFIRWHPTRKTFMTSCLNTMDLGAKKGSLIFL